MGDVMTTPMKACPHCKQEIPADATRCHYCREWVSRKTTFKRALVPVLLIALMWGGMWYFIERDIQRSISGEQQYWDHPEAIKIVSHHATKGAKGTLYVIGTIKNTSDISWDMITVQVDYLDAKNQLVDTSQDYSMNKLSPGQEQAFKVTFEEPIPGAQYDHYRVTIADAKDTSWF